ncbi:putative bifunctional diguanylate cyclase/phosphodiesterase [Paenibacillus aestuarii]|uniref:Bifunctional diguanylate cyclase/phosphodiesterase n=1 Tax=Paenibacillus aestuarii TaxID=516965 RepID=A0ABW0KD89_9BACL|nr:EAL domain-containing protein [Paenibacillus aestuarii]
MNKELKAKCLQHTKAYAWAYIAIIGCGLLTVNLLAAASFPLQPHVWVGIVLQGAVVLLAARWIQRLLDISEAHQQRSREFAHMAYHDDLTGLPNRRLFDDRLKRALLHAQRHEHLVAVMFLDLDRFKGVNDTLGHASGDLLIRQAGRRLLRSLRREDTVFRQGGDEFTILLDHMAKPEDVGTVAARIQAELEEPFMLDGTPVSVTASIGIALYPADGDTPELLMQRADEALDSAKERGHSRFQFFAADIDAMVSHKAKLEKELYAALNQKEFELVYQPRYEIDTGRVKGVEAVLQWSRGKNNKITQPDWRKIANETGVIVPIGHWMLDTACRQVKFWQENGFPDLRLTVGMSAVQFEDEFLIETLKLNLNETGICASCVEFDLTESLTTSSVQKVGEKLRQLKALGVRILMDDLSISLFMRPGMEDVPMDSVKLDSTLIRDLPGDEDNQMLIEAIIRMARRLGLTILAKGVETKEQLEHLQHLQCTEVQGPLFSEPLHPAEFLDRMGANITQSAM